MYRDKSIAAETEIDEFELTLETLKDLTVSGRDALDIKGGKTSSIHQACYCGTL